LERRYSRFFFSTPVADRTEEDPAVAAVVDSLEVGNLAVEGSLETDNLAEVDNHPFDPNKKKNFFFQ
jgi:hypothetical protein